MGRTVSTATKKLTFEEWQNLPETKQRYEIVDGVMKVPPGATYFHQRLLRRLVRQLEDYVEGGDLGEVLTAPLDLLIQRQPLRTRQPDILYLSNERVPGRTRDEVIGVQFLEVGPDLAVEILSPSNTPREIAGRLRDYHQVGVRECWLVNPKAATIEILDLTGSEPRPVATFGGSNTLVTDLLPGFELNLSEVFR